MKRPLSKTQVFVVVLISGDGAGSRKLLQSYIALDLWYIISGLFRSIVLGPGVLKRKVLGEL